MHHSKIRYNVPLLWQPGLPFCIYSEDNMSDYLMTNYAPLPVNFVRGEGVWLWDTEERIYLDALSGIGVCGLGHAHPAVTQAIQAQAGRLLHTSNLYHIGQQKQLAQQLCQLTTMDKVMFGNSGAEAVEAALKLARLYGHRRKINKPVVVVTENSFHGRTLATLSATGNRKVQAGFEPLMQGFIRVPYNDLAAIRKVAESSADVVAVLVEPIQGEGGIQIPDDNYLAGIRDLCNRQDWLMMLDEIQTGMGRTGQWLACQHDKIRPDIISLAKGLGNGVPIGACLARGEAATLFTPGSHGSTFGGNPLVCSAALAVIETLRTEQLCQRATAVGHSLLSSLQAALANCDAVIDIRGKGLMIGIELDRPCTGLLQMALQRGLLISVQRETVIRLLPPLIISDDEAYQIVTTISHIIEEFTASSS